MLILFTHVKCLFMGMIHELNRWSDLHHPRWLVVLRAVLGLSLLFKGISFISNTVALQAILTESRLPSDPWLSYAIAWVHLFGGILIIAGLFTRWAVLAQIPVLLGAVVFVNTNRGVFAAESEFGLSLIILLLLMFFFVEGSGPVSLDHFFAKNPD